jgi:hypothetical protein
MSVRPRSREGGHPRNPPAAPGQRSTALEAPADSAVSKTAKPTVSNRFLGINDDLRHSDIGLHTLANVHCGGDETNREQRGLVLLDADAKHPERFVRKIPTPPVPRYSRSHNPESRPPTHQFDEETNIALTFVC